MINLILQKKIKNLTSLEKFDKYIVGTLYKNSLLLILTKGINAAFGFIFWIVAARYYSIEDLGLSVALFSYMGLVVAFSRLGFDFSLIRFFPNNDKSSLFSTCLIITTVSTLALGIISILIVDIISPALSSLQDLHYSLVYILCAILNSIALTIGIAFVALRRSDYYLIQNILLGIRVPLLIPFAVLGFYGILGSVTMAYVFGSFGLFILLSRQIKLKLFIDRQFIRKSFDFSMGNFISNILYTLPALIMPIMILNLLGETESAKYYIAFTIGNLLLIVPDSLSTSLFVEGSHGENLRKNVIRAGSAIYFILIPAAIFMYFFGDYLLYYFGKDYSEGLDLLRLLILSILLSVPLYLFIPVQNIRMNVKNIVQINLIRFFVFVVSSYIFILKFGIEGVGLAWIITNGTLCLIIINIMRKNI